MAKVKRNWDFISEDQRRHYVRELIYFFENERDEKIGIIAAENLLDHFLQTVGIGLYNQGVEESVRFLKNHWESLELDLECLRK